MKKGIIFALVIGLVIGFFIGTQINRYKLETTSYQVLKLDRFTGRTWIMSPKAGGWVELQEK